MKELKKILTIPVLVVALGYFVDIFDLTLFNMLRVPSLDALGVLKSEQVEIGILLLNSQMFGMLLGGILWGVLGDKKGRLQVLFGSILMYSLANFANAFVTNIPTYAILRFVSGVGLAGELGAGITLIAEILPKEKRGLGTTLVATIGVLGATLGGLVVEYFDWRVCFAVGGVLGFALLFLRVKVHESGMFEKTKHDEKVNWGQFSSLFTSQERFKKFLKCILIGVPIWFIAGLVMAFSPELAQEMGVLDPIFASKTISISYLGLAFGDLFSGMLSQKLQSRKKSLQIFMLVSIFFLLMLFNTSGGRGQTYYYTLCFLIGVGAGFWAVFVTVAAEQFGTNIRATVATTVPNFVRGAVIPMTLTFKLLKNHFSIQHSMMMVGFVVFGIAILSSILLPETFHKDLDYLEI